VSEIEKIKKKIRFGENFWGKVNAESKKWHHYIKNNIYGPFELPPSLSLSSSLKTMLRYFYSCHY
jgi:hypothetical protein